MNDGPTARTRPARPGRRLMRQPQRGDAWTATPKPRPWSGSRPRDASLLRELVAYLRDSRTELREEGVAPITEAHLLSVMTPTRPSPR
jgi:hypothetical protein